MTNRGHFESILTAVVTAVAATSPAKTKATASQRIPLCEFRFPEGDTACYQAASETDPIDGLTATDAEFIPTGECRVFLVKTPEARTLTEPLAVPLRFGTAGDTVGLGSQMAERGQRMNRSDAVAAMMRHNRGVIGRGGVLAAGMADRMLHSALMTTGQEIPQRFFHRRARAVAIGMISPTLGETLDDLR